MVEPQTQAKCLSAAECSDHRKLESFIRREISPNAWPVLSPLLTQRILADGLNLGLAREFLLSASEFQSLLRRLYDHGCRAEKELGIGNAFHTTVHNFEVLLRLLQLEWPADRRMPNDIRSAPLQMYTRYEDLEPPLLRSIDALLEAGVSSARLAKCVLSAAGHDYGHTGGTDRLDADGKPAALSHEDFAERHVAEFGLELGFPLALILESLAGIRATTFFSRPGREQVKAANLFERQLTLADVAGCILPPDQWLTHVGIPVYREKLPGWKKRLQDRPKELLHLQTVARAGGPEGKAASAALAELQIEEALIVQDVAEWFKSERGFLCFIAEHRLKPVPQAVSLWGPILEDRIARIERVLADDELTQPLVDVGFPLLEAFVETFANADARERLASGDIDPRLVAVVEKFLCEG